MANNDSLRDKPNISVLPPARQVDKPERLLPETQVKPIVPQTLPEALELAQALARSTFVPKDYIGKPGDILAAILYGSELGLKPLQSLQNVASINGRPAVWGDAALAICLNHPECIDIIETFDEQTQTATCIAKRRGKEDKIRSFSRADAQKAGLWNKEKTPWTKYPERMLQQRARGFAIRDQFPDALKGLITAEEAADYDDSPAAPNNRGQVSPKNNGQVPQNQGQKRLETTKQAETSTPNANNDGAPSAADFANRIMRCRHAEDLQTVLYEESETWRGLFPEKTKERAMIESAIARMKKKYSVQ